jgi:hypothetical protein
MFTAAVCFCLSVTRLPPFAGDAGLFSSACRRRRPRPRSATRRRHFMPIAARLFLHRKSASDGLFQALRCATLARSLLSQTSAPYDIAMFSFAASFIIQPAAMLRGVFLHFPMTPMRACPSSASCLYDAERTMLMCAMTLPMIQQRYDAPPVLLTLAVAQPVCR